MKLKKTKLLSLIMAAALVFESAGMNVVAANNTVQNDAVVSIEEVLDVTAGDVADVTISGTIDGDEVTEGTTDGDVSEGNVQAPVTDVTAGDVSEGDVSEGDVTGGDVEEVLFPGLPEEYVLSAEQLADKAVLAEHASDIADIPEAEVADAYVEGQLVYLTDSEEEAEVVAAAFGGTLESYGYGVAVIQLAENRTVVQAVAAAADKYMKLPAVWPNYYKYSFATYNDPALKDWNTNWQWQHKFVGSKTAWENGYTGKGVKLGVIDTGVLNSHEEFGSRLVKHVNMSSSSAVASTTDVDGHGTHVSGIAAASVNNNKGGAGIAPEASLYVYGLCDSKGGMSTAAMLRAVNLAVTDKLDVINMSLGSTYYSADEEKVIKAAYDAGVAVFVAAGNDGANVHNYPASCDGACSIASLQADGTKSSFSNYNDKVQLAFPGSDIYSTSASGSSQYEYMSGTSMACPVATGVAAVILSGAADIPELNGLTGGAKVDALFKVMKSNVKKSSQKGLGAGTTYLPYVWDLTVNEMDVVPETPTFDLPNKTKITENYYYLKITSGTTEGVTIYYNRYGGTPKFKNGVVTNGYVYDGESLRIGGQKKQTVRAIAVNHATGKVSKVATATYTFEPNPSSVSVTCANGTYKAVPGSKITLKASVSPSHAVSKKVVWSVTTKTGAAATGITVKNGKVTVAKEAAAGEYYIVATAVDKKGNPFTTTSGSKIEGKYYLKVLDASKVVKKAVFANKKVNATVDKPLSLLNDVTVTYADGSTAVGAAADLVWTSSNTYVARVDNEGNITARNPGKATIKATVNDGSNKCATCTVTVVQLATGGYIYKDIQDTYYEDGEGKLAAGKNVKMKVSLEPYDVSSKAVDWSIAPVSGAAGTVKIDKGGKVTASKDAAGVYTVTAATKDGSGVTLTYKLTIVSTAITGITMDKTMKLFVADVAGNKSNAVRYQKLATTVKDGLASEIFYYSSNYNVAYVGQDGTVYANGSGTATIYCVALDGSNKKATCKVTVGVPMSSMTIVPADKNDGYVCEGASMKLKVVAGSAYGVAQNQKVVKWSVAPGSENKITVSNGVVKAKKGICASGGYITTATVIAETTDGSNVKTSYTVIILPEMKSAQAVVNGYGISVYGVNSSNKRVSYYRNAEKEGYIFALPYTVELSAPKGVKASIDRGVDSFGGTFFQISLAEYTTNKAHTAVKPSDGVKIKVKVNLQGTNKTATTNITVAYCPDGYTVWWNG